MTGSGRQARDLLRGPAIAHRGLWRPSGAPENSLAAFEAACVGGYGIELDVRLSSDSEAMVFHDADLRRMTGAAGRVIDRTAAELADLRLAGTGEPIPTLAQVLQCVAGRSLVLVELKTDPGAEGPLETRVAEILDGYNGPVAIIGFNPVACGWFAEHRPDVLRGLNLERVRGAETVTALAEARPQFLLPSRALKLKPPYDAVPKVVWTVRSAREVAALRGADNIIFEGFAP
ncbi:MAG: glycerophosphodiester phosphodiesterase family protein [Caulobacteraceae bacterium]